MSGRPARWIRLGLVDPLGLHAAYSGLAIAQASDAAPILVWAQAKTDLWLGLSQGPAEPDARVAAPVLRRPRGGGLVRVNEYQYVFVLIAPKRHAPGRPARWISWALAPAIATYRHFGLSAYLNQQSVWLHGRRISGSGAATIGECAVIASSFLLRFPSERVSRSDASRSPEFRTWLREGLSLALTEWADHGARPAERELEETFRARIEAQHGWQFEHAWPSEAELAAIAEARAGLCEPAPEDAPRGVRDGIRLHAEARRVGRAGSKALEREPQAGRRLKRARANHG